MKFQLAQAEGFLITHYAPGVVRVNAQDWSESFLLFPEHGPSAWPGLGQPEWQKVVDYAPNVLVIGTGEKHVFPSPALLRPLIEARIGYEVMNTAAACRTYNVLVSEGRRVCAAIVV